MALTQRTAMNLVRITALVLEIWAWHLRMAARIKVNYQIGRSPMSKQRLVNQNNRPWAVIKVAKLRQLFRIRIAVFNRMKTTTRTRRTLARELVVL